MSSFQIFLQLLRGTGGKDFEDVCRYDDERAKKYKKKQEEEENKKKYRNDGGNCTISDDCGYALFCFREPFKQGHCVHRT